MQQLWVLTSDLFFEKELSNLVYMNLTVPLLHHLRVGQGKIPVVAFSFLSETCAGGHWLVRSIQFINRFIMQEWYKILTCLTNSTKTSLLPEKCKPGLLRISILRMSGILVRDVGVDLQFSLCINSRLTILHNILLFELKEKKKKIIFFLKKIKYNLYFLLFYYFFKNACLFHASPNF